MLRKCQANDANEKQIIISVYPHRLSCEHSLGLLGATPTCQPELCSQDIHHSFVSFAGYLLDICMALAWTENPPEKRIFDDQISDIDI